MTEITLRGVSKSYEGVQALKPVDMIIPAGKFTTLLGPSGCGKTTLLRLIAGLETPDSGEIVVDGQPVFSQTRRVNLPPHKRHFGMVFQEFALWPHMTVYENVAFSLKANGQKHKIRERVQHALEQVRLTGMEKRQPHQLSGGQQQRVAFARAIVMQPGLILFDEPLSALDAMLREDMRDELMSLVRELGLTALYVTHDQTEAMSMSDEIMVMQSGNVLQRGTPEQIYREPVHSFVARFIGRSNWIEPEQTLFRPEHGRWEAKGEAGEHSYTATVQRVSYMGDRYEIELNAGEGRSWTAYHDQRMSIGSIVQLYVSAEHLCTVGERTSTATEKMDANDTSSSSVGRQHIS
ncbi:ABC transporter ATP-binding protein [Paenibacillus hunanensis]|uniref:ABC transporter ATP-binding protein n=1 Tax=Paenibacillus hunanensis TaxID=539262 RepID=UPI002A6A6C6E|nr:ABC transporter ATP-binding protein [Paenibacillus hunanensis]WPP40182.1 ABC transporter ATP-binding protein [Paenibacillus hunanensis]